MKREELIILFIFILIGVSTLLGSIGGIYLLYRIKHPHKVNIHRNNARENNINKQLNYQT